jgi:hypothetical protein
MARQKVQLVLTAVDKTKAAFASANKSLVGLQTATRTLVAGFAAVGAAIGVGSVAMGSFAKSATEAQKPLIDMAKLIGVTADKMSELEIAGQLAGIGTTQLTTGLQRQTRRISEAAQNTGEAVKALKELGLEARALNRLSPDKQFERIAEAMGNIASRGDQVRLSMKLWDSEGVKLLNTIGELEQAQKIALETGAVLTQKEVEAFNEMADAIVRTEATFKSFQQTIVNSGAGPAIESLKQTSIGLLETWIKLAVTGSIWDAIKSRIFALSGATKAADDLITQILDRFEEFDGTTAQNKPKEAVDNYTAAVVEASKATKVLKDDMDRMLDIAISDESRLNRDDAANQMGGGPEFRAKLKAFNDEQKAAQDELNKARQDANKEAEEALRKQKQFADQVAATMTSAFSEAVTEGEKLSDVFDSLLKDLAQMVIRMAVLRPLAQGISGGIAGYLPAFAGGTRNAPGGLALVGEQGPEIVNLPKGSQVIPNGAMGGGTVVNVINAPPDTRVE